MPTTLITKQLRLTNTDLAKIVADANCLGEQLECRRRDQLTLDAMSPDPDDTQLAPGQPLPPWAETLRRIIQTAANIAPNPAFSWPTNPEQPIPFEDIWLPTVQVARQNLLNRLGSTQLAPSTLPLCVFTDNTYSTLERTLLQRLSHLSSQTLNVEFSKKHSFSATQLNQLGIKESELEEANNQYQQFVHALLQDGLLSFFQTYPALGRLIAITVDLWVDTTVEFMQRLTQNYGEIQQRFVSDRSKPMSLGKVIDIKASLSDPDNQGYTGLLLTFGSGLNLVYNPKDLGLEAA